MSINKKIISVVITIEEQQTDEKFNINDFFNND